ncbi:MAG: selenide, water dikinase SelD [Gemmatimonadota bacterium]|jgi:selenide,water dikinase
MSELTHVLRHVVPVDDPNALVGYATGDDAAVYRLADDRALVVTADFFTPIVDDPYDFGRIAAANALSDVYAMGARPLFVLNLVGFPRDLLPEGVLEEILRGGSEVARDAGVPTLGGHSIDDEEPKYGLVAVGEVDPAKMVTNSGARPGDALVLTKPIGSGIIATAIKKGAAAKDAIAGAIESMATLNRRAADAMLQAGVSAATDVTGFGLLGHLHRMLHASGVAGRLRTKDVPLLAGARELAEAGHVPGGTHRNLADLESCVDFASSVDEANRILLGDAQTSGGLLMSVPVAAVEGLLEELTGNVPVASVVGEVLEGPAGHISVE